MSGSNSLRIVEPSRARAARQQHVDTIIELMARGEWGGAGSVAHFAGQWEVDRQTVASYAREAAGVVARMQDSETLEQARSLQLATASRIRMAMLRKVDLDDDPHVQVKAASVAIAATEMHAKLLGTFAPQKIELMQSEEAWRALPVAEKRVRLRMARERIERLEQQVAEEEARANGGG